MSSSVRLCWELEEPQGPKRPKGQTPKHRQSTKAPEHRTIRKKAGLFCGSFLRKVEVLAYVGLIQIINDLNAAGGWFVHALLGGARGA